MASGRYGKKKLAAATIELVATLPSGAQPIININVCNQGAGDAKVRIAIGDGVAPGDDDWIEYDATVGGNGVLERTGIACSSGEKVWVRADTANVSVRVHGVEE